MADISQITQELTQFGPAPDGNDPATFNQRADATVKHLHTHVNEQNTITKQTNKVTREINARATDIDEKYDEVVAKHTDFIPKYNEVVTKHGEVVTMHGEVEADASYVGARKGEIDTIKTHIDNTKTQIDADLETAKSMINEGNGGVIDDTKTSDVSTWSSKFLTEKLAEKMDNTQVYTQEQADEKFVDKLTSNFLATDVFQKSDSGYMKLSNGFIAQWKKITLQPGTFNHDGKESFPIAFPNRCLGGVISAAFTNDAYNDGVHVLDVMYSYGGFTAFTKTYFRHKSYSNQSYKNEPKYLIAIAFGY